MKITQILSENKLTLSVEVFPPKTVVSFESVKNAAKEISRLNPSFISVTYGAGGGTSEYTLDLAKDIEENDHVPSLAHLTCVSSTSEYVRNMIQKMKEYGIENVMALRGDINNEIVSSGRLYGDFTYASDLIREIKNSGADFCIGGACYPEVHPESRNQAEDIEHLKEKVDAGCDFLTTQMFFDNNILYNFLYKIRENGIVVPVLPGIMPITSAKQVDRAIKLSGSFMPRRFASLVDKFGYSEPAMCQAGIAYATEQIIDLFSNGITNVHLYSMNNSFVAQKIMDNLSDILN